MPNYQVSLSETASAYIEGQVNAGIYRTPSEAASALIEAASKLEAGEKLAKFIQTGLDSGPSIEVTDEWLEAHRQDLLTRRPSRASE